MTALLAVSLVLLAVLPALTAMRAVVGEREAQAWGDVRRPRSPRLRRIDTSMLAVTAALVVALVAYYLAGSSG